MSFSDLLFAFTEWLRTTSIVELTLWISNTSLSLWIGTHFWAIPIFQTIHIIAIAAAFGSVLMINLRVVGLRANGRTMAQTVNRYQPWIWWALLVLVFSGSMLVTGEPIRNMVNPIFWIKMGLIITMIIVSLLFNRGVARRKEQWDTTRTGRGLLYAGAWVLIALWCAIIFGGRWIAYAPV